MRLINLLLAAVSLAYPFIVYAGMDHLSRAWFALLLAALWLARAPALWRQPGGRWMLGAALAYCVVLVLSGHAALLRWYPTLINALLLAAFGLSLRYGPPMVERFARLQEPDLDARGVRYTRTVTWVWVGFFIVNGSISAVLTL